MDTTRRAADVRAVGAGRGGCDALVLFGATGNLARKQIFSALYAMTKRGALNVPVVGVAYSGWSLEQLRNLARESIAHSTGGIDDRRALSALLSRLRHVDGDYKDSDTFAALKEALGKASRPAHYLAIRLSGDLDLPYRPLSRQGRGREPSLFSFLQLFPGADLEPQLGRQCADHDGREVWRGRTGGIL